MSQATPETFIYCTDADSPDNININIDCGERKLQKTLGPDMDVKAAKQAFAISTSFKNQESLKGQHGYSDADLQKIQDSLWQSDSDNSESKEDVSDQSDDENDSFNVKGVVRAAINAFREYDPEALESLKAQVADERQADLARQDSLLHICYTKLLNIMHRSQGYCLPCDIWASVVSRVHFVTMPNVCSTKFSVSRFFWSGLFSYIANKW